MPQGVEGDRWEIPLGADCKGLPHKAKTPAGSGEPAMIFKQWGSNTTSFVSEEVDENREFLTYAIPEENAA